ncbi:MAG: GspE/PulE family protein [Spirochaetes bacterium]|nr:GspE/PulE family protein [Spirochaetota bacterium]
MNNIDLDNIQVNPEDQFHFEYIKHNRVIKIFQDDHKIVIARDDSVSKEFINELLYLYRNFETQFVSVNQKDFDTLLRKAASENDNNLSSLTGGSSGEDLAKLASDAPVVNLVNEILMNALDKKASDVHFEACEDFFQVRIRIDGYLQTTGTYSKNLYEAVCARLKVMSKLDITQRRLAQDGKAQLSLYGKRIDIRTSTLPTIYGESIVLRFLGLDDELTDLSSLGFLPQDIAICEKIIKKSFGAFIITGPTGSGKTTTLRSMLGMLDNVRKKIITIEDPVEYTVEGLSQVQVNDKIGYSFSTILRNLLRQDPDVIMVGEMRDTETADLALRSAMTGHLVFSTLHTNDAVSSISRLLHMDIAPYIIESSIIGAAAQRLVRRLCPHCKKKLKPEKIDFNLYEKYQLSITELYQPIGCKKCNQSGFIGRKAFFEVFEMDEAVREMIVQNQSIAVIRNYLKTIDFVTIFQKGLEAAAKGDVFLEEVKSIIGEIK